MHYYSHKDKIVGFCGVVNMIQFSFEDLLLHYLSYSLNAGLLL